MVPQPLLVDELPLAALERVDAHCVQFEAEWKAGRPPVLAAVLGAAEGSERSVLLCELLRVELHYRRRKGQTPSPQEYLLAFPADGVAVDAAFEAVSNSESVVAPSEWPREWPKIPGYRVVGVLGRGGMGVVYLAEQENLPRLVAVKVLSHPCLANSEQVDRFLREAQALARVEHENVVRIYDKGEVAGQPFFTMEFVAGGSLERYLTGGLPAARAAELVETLAQAVARVHQQGILHRDLKPANVLLAFDPADEGGSPQPSEKPWYTRSFRPKIADFGLARFLGDSLQTNSGRILGTPAYMAPEQADGRQGDIGPATDVWALGVILYECLTGQRPFEAEGGVPQSREHVLRYLRTANPAVPAALEVICLKCLEREPAERYPTAGELAEDLHSFRVTGRSPRAAAHQRRRQVRAALLLLLVGGVLALGMWGVGLVIRANSRLEDPRKVAEEKLAAGLEARFIGHEPLPGPFRLQTKTGNPIASREDRCITVEALGTALLEFVKPVGNRSRFSVQVRHDLSGADSSDVGLYFGFQEARTAAGERVGGFYSLSFDDRSESARKLHSSSVKLESMLFVDLAGRQSLFSSPGPGFAKVAFEPALTAPYVGPWRLIEVRVTPDEVTVASDVQGRGLEEIKTLKAGVLERVRRDGIGTFADVRPLSPTFEPRGGLGLYVRNGTASFRQIVVEPSSDRRP